jgi:hypothetical protein
VVPRKHGSQLTARADDQRELFRAPAELLKQRSLPSPRFRVSLMRRFHDRSTLSTEDAYGDPSAATALPIDTMLVLALGRQLPVSVRPYAACHVMRREGRRACWSSLASYDSVDQWLPQ